MSWEATMISFFPHLQTRSHRGEKKKNHFNFFKKIEMFKSRTLVNHGFLLLLRGSQSPVKEVSILRTTRGFRGNRASLTTSLLGPLPVLPGPWDPNPDYSPPEPGTFYTPLLPGSAPTLAPLVLCPPHP